MNHDNLGGFCILPAVKMGRSVSARCFVMALTDVEVFKIWNCIKVYPLVN